eukprot:g13270.t1
MIFSCCFSYCRRASKDSPEASVAPAGQADKRTLGLACVQGLPGSESSSGRVGRQTHAEPVSKSLARTV